MTSTLRRSRTARLSKSEKTAKNDAEGIHQIIDALQGGPMTTGKIRLHTGGMGRGRAERLLGRMLHAGTVAYEDIKVCGALSEIHGLQ